jgi:hypothetical protein
VAGSAFMLVTSPTSVEFRLVGASEPFSILVPLGGLRRVLHLTFPRAKGFFSTVTVHQLRFAWDPGSVIATFEVPEADVCQELRLLRRVWAGPITLSQQLSCTGVGATVQPSPYVMALSFVP